MFAAIILLLILPLYTYFSICQSGAVSVYSSAMKISCAFYIMVFFILIFLGSNPAAAPYVVSSKVFTILYFLYFLMLTPILLAKFFLFQTVRIVLPITTSILSCACYD